jgi:outer membrane immunogenic protein
MRTALLATVAAVALSGGAASAADIPVYEPPVEMAPVPTVHDWSGFYLGLQVGGAWGEENDDLSETVTCPPGAIFVPGLGCAFVADNFDIDGVIGGGHAGFNIQSGAFVFGLEGDAEGSGVEGSDDHFGNVGFGGISITSLDGVLSFEQDWRASVRARLGLAFDRVLVYGTGGIAFSEGTLDFSGEYVRCSLACFDSGPFSTSDSKVHIGWTAGLGGAFAFNERWSGRLEARYTDFGEETYELEAEGYDIPVDVDFDQISVTGGISYSF